MSTVKISAAELHSLNEQTIDKYIQEFLCDDSDGTFNEAILTSTDFVPDTFTVSDRLSPQVFFLAPEERDGEHWVKSLVEHELGRLENGGVITVDSHDAVTSFCTRQLHKFFEHKIGDQPVSSVLTNQEVPDVVRKVLAYVLFGDPLRELHTHRAFNELALSIIPKLIERNLWRQGFTLKELLLYSIASGLIGLDLKGGAAAASNLATITIPLKPLIGQTNEAIQESLWTQLSQCVSKGLLIDRWDEFYDCVICNKCNLIWFLDDYIESFFDFLLIQQMLESNPSLTVTVVPKRTRCGSDMAYSDALQVMSLSIFESLNQHVCSGRVIISPHGPSMAAVNLRKLSREIITAIINSDCVLIKGCRAHELVQGGLNKVSYTAYAVAREFSESETGFDSRLSPLLFFKGIPGEYAYWGFKGRAKRRKAFDDGRIISICYSTLEEHERRKQLDDPRKIITEIDRLLAIQEDIIGDGYTKSYYEEIRSLVDKLVNLTRDAYNVIAQEYKTLRREQPHSIDIQLFDRLLELARPLVHEGRLGDSDGRILLLDVGTGSGRDLRYFRQFRDVKATGIDNSEAFIAILHELARKGEIPPDSFFKMDMRDLSFDTATFDVVRHNATLLHLPLIAPGIGVDVAIAESYRVLKPFGLLFVNVKAGSGMEIVDTGEGLGSRFFQFFSKESLRQLLLRNHFIILEIQEWHEDRPSGQVDWLVAYAQKGNSNSL